MVKSPILGKQTPNFVIGLIIIKVNIERLEKVIRKFLRNYFTLTIVLMHNAQLKEREIFWQHRLKTFYPIGLNEKEEYLH